MPGPPQSLNQQGAPVGSCSEWVQVPPVQAAVPPPCQAAVPMSHVTQASPTAPAPVFASGNGEGLARSWQAPGLMPGLLPLGTVPGSVTLAPPPSCGGMVQAINGAHGGGMPPVQNAPPQLVPMTCHPAVYQTIFTPMPKHKGDSTSWPEFRQKWSERVKLLVASGPVDNQILLTQFADAMDSVAKKIIEARRAEDDTLTYQQFFAEIDAHFSKSARQSSRARLESICLKSTYGTRMTMKEFEAFDAEFRLLRSECREVGDEEAKRLYQRALPTFLIENLQKKYCEKSNPRPSFCVA